ncbi:transposase IS204/IS1001/IS1096/IS1165 family domain protein, partial [Bordetella holmesii 30539]
NIHRLRPARAWDHWLQQAQGSGIAALAHFALKLKAYLHGILSRCRHRLNTSISRGHQQHHQSHQAPRLRLPRSGVTSFSRYGLHSPVFLDEPQKNRHEAGFSAAPKL